MKIKTGFVLRNVCGENVIVAEGLENIDFSKIIALNETAAFIWKTAKEKESFSEEDLAKALTEEYEVDEATALGDVQAQLQLWRELGMVE